MADNVKVLISERNSTELGFQEEYALIPSNIPLTAAGLDATDLQEGVEELSNLTGPLVVPIPLVFNGTLGGGDFIGYSNLIPGDDTPVISPITGTFVGYTWSNNKSTCDFALEFRKNSTTGTPFYTWSVDNTQTADITIPTPESFSSGDAIYIKYIDEGLNASDAVIILKFKS